jgi:DNA (cytosine-5)-methyltransferase 1
MAKSRNIVREKSQTKKSGKALRVVELFAGVGGFRIGLERVKGTPFKIVWSNQYEPGSAKQWASWVYEHRWPETADSKHSNKLIEDAIEAGEIPAHDVLVGGFPCQDYSVAKPNNQSKGIEGKKGVLWWSIYRIAEKHKPDYLILENVDRLVKSPANQRGRDFAIMLRCLQTLGYHIEWRVINAADYGMPQKRRRVFIVGYHKDTALGKELSALSPKDLLLQYGLLAKTFPVSLNKPDDNDGEDNEDGQPVTSTVNPAIVQPLLGLDESLATVKLTLSEPPHVLSETHAQQFLNAGVSLARKKDAEVHMATLFPYYKGHRTLLGDILLPDAEVSEEYHIKKDALVSWKRQKLGKREMRANYQTTVNEIFTLFAKAGIKVNASDARQRNAWARALTKYWKSDSAEPLQLTLLEGGKSLKVSHKLIAETRFEYEFAEGSLPIPDPIDRPMRTIITSEGGASPSRFKHLICRECAKRWTKERRVITHDCLAIGKLRRLTPEELEAGNMFPKGHTETALASGEKIGVSAGKRAFFMGNALVCGVITRIGKSLVFSI